MKPMEYKALFICSTDYQIINALNIKKNLLSHKSADIIILNNRPFFKELVARLEKISVFENTYFYTERHEGLRNYLKGLTRNEEILSFPTALLNTYKNLHNKLVGKIEQIEDGINRKILNHKKIDFSQYDEIFAVTSTPIVFKSLEILATRFNRDNILNVIDEGLGSYLNWAISGIYKPKAIYLYQPRLAVYRNKFNNFIAIPKINKNDTTFIKDLNFIFNFKNEDKIDLSNKIIYFDQPWNMPKYLLKGIMKRIFHKRYKKHFQDFIVYEKKLQFLRSLLKQVPTNKLYIKPHPRSNKEFLDDYRKLGISILPNTDLPWELYLCNCEIKDNIWLSINSSSLLSYPLSFNKSKDDNSYIYLYKSFFNNNVELNEFFKEFKKFQHNLYAPEDEDGCLSLIDTLLKNNLS